MDRKIKLLLIYNSTMDGYNIFEVLPLKNINSRLKARIYIQYDLFDKSIVEAGFILKNNNSKNNGLYKFDLNPKMTSV